jgi:pSer/pThr/pTyr-binding forkhead associated (FHA) protein
MKIQLKDGSNQKILSLQLGKIVIGRSANCDLQLESQTVSSMHASIELFDGKPVVCDLNSSNGVFVNGRKISGRRELKLGSRISFGDESIQIEVLSGAPKSSTQTYLLAGSIVAALGVLAFVGIAAIAGILLWTNRGESNTTVASQATSEQSKAAATNNGDDPKKKSSSTNSNSTKPPVTKTSSSTSSNSSQPTTTQNLNASSTKPGANPGSKGKKTNASKMTLGFSAEMNQRFDPNGIAVFNSDGGIGAVRLSRSQKKLFVGYLTGNVRVFDVFTGDIDQQFKALDTAVDHILESNDGKYLVAAGESMGIGTAIKATINEEITKRKSSTLRVWDTSNWGLVHDLRTQFDDEPIPFVHSLDLSRDGKLLVGWSKGIRLFDLASGNEQTAATDLKPSKLVQTGFPAVFCSGAKDLFAGKGVAYAHGPKLHLDSNPSYVFPQIPSRRQLGAFSQPICNRLVVDDQNSRIVLGCASVSPNTPLRMGLDCLAQGMIDVTGFDGKLVRRLILQDLGDVIALQLRGDSLFVYAKRPFPTAQDRDKDGARIVGNKASEMQNLGKVLQGFADGVKDIQNLGENLNRAANGQATNFKMTSLEIHEFETNGWSLVRTWQDCGQHDGDMDASKDGKFIFVGSNDGLRVAKVK